MKVRADLIIRYVETKYQVPHNLLLSGRRIRRVARPRQIAMYLLRKMTLLSLPSIGIKLGGRDHTTVLHAMRRVESLMLADTEFNIDIISCMRDLTAISESDAAADNLWPVKKDMDVKIAAAVKAYIDALVAHEIAPPPKIILKKIRHDYLGNDRYGIPQRRGETAPT